tara:strand:+ start:771 stop:1082 length:312 start_codon:yes stop_codon:yes gene_type:complete
MEDNDKKPSTLQKVMGNLTQSTTNVEKVDFKNKPNDIVQILEEGTDAILITYEKKKSQITLYYNGNEIDKAVFAKKLKAETGFYALFDYVQDKFRSWSDAWVN